VNCPIDRVWECFTDIKHLEIINPKEIELKITKVTSHKLAQGSEIWVEGKITIMLSKRSKRYSMITSFSVSPSVSPQQRQYVDEMLTGPFEKWRHFLSITTTTKSKRK
jgi:ligand-binding SRPBCC domain-containing protein